jgi:acetyl esterase/lipase
VFIKKSLVDFSLNSLLGCWLYADLFLEEDIEYARRLIRAGVPTELHVYPGAFHGYNLVADAQVSQTALRDELSALKRALLNKEV